MKKRCRIGTWKDEHYKYILVVDVEIDKEGELHITGNTRLQPVGGGHLMEDSGGQNYEDLIAVTHYAEGWNEDKALRLLALWKRWHLNHLRAGSPVQEDWLRANPVVAVYPESHYKKASEELARAGINPDEDGYLYGHEWKREELPDKVVVELCELTFDGVDLDG